MSTETQVVHVPGCDDCSTDLVTGDGIGAFTTASAGIAFACQHEGWSLEGGVLRCAGCTNEREDAAY